MSVKQSLQAAALRESLRYVRRNPEENFARLLGLIRPFARLPWHQEIIRQAGRCGRIPRTTGAGSQKGLYGSWHPRSRRRS